MVLLAILAVDFAIFATGCIDTFRPNGTHRLRDDPPRKGRNTLETPPRDADAGSGSSDTPMNDAVEYEEQQMEDPEALSALIASKRDSGSSDDHQAEGPPDPTGVLVFSIGIPPAKENLKLSGRQCIAELKKRDVPFEIPDFKTPLIDTPVLFFGTIAGVRIGPRDTGRKRLTKAVMDCHLALALVQVAHHAASLGIAAIEYYSIYRPLKPPPKRCPKKGKARKRCLKKRRKYRRARTAQKSQHRFGRAIDIRWLKTTDGRTLDVLEHFDRRAKHPPCSYIPKDDAAKILSDFVCGIHRYRLFNVMLTPNANRAHHNHFHFDLTPGARYYIIR